MSECSAARNGPTLMELRKPVLPWLAWLSSASTDPRMLLLTDTVEPRRTSSVLAVLAADTRDALRTSPDAPPR